MMNKNDYVKWLKLCNVSGLGPKRILKLFDLYGDINSIWNSQPNELLRTGVFKEKMIENWLQLKNASNQNFNKIIDNCEENDITIIPLYSNHYPIQLKFIPNPPLNLFLQGDITLLNLKKVAIVGSRSSNNKSKKWAFETAIKLSEDGVVIVSGGAKGIDIEAHKGALSVSGKTISVMGTGLLNLYPEDHIPIFKEIRESGLLISENSPFFTGGKFALLNRNRITSGISDALIIVTSSSNGGAMAQLKHAYSQRVPILCTKKNLNFTPREGIDKVKQQYGIKEIEAINQVLETINNNNFPNPSAQQTTLQ